MVKQIKALISTIFILVFLFQKIIFAQSIVSLNFTNMVFDINTDTKPGHIWYAPSGNDITHLNSDSIHYFELNANEIGKQVYSIKDLPWNTKNSNPFGTAMFWKQDADDPCMAIWTKFDLQDSLIDNRSKFNGNDKRKKINTYVGNVSSNPIFTNIFNENFTRLNIIPIWHNFDKAPLVQFEIEDPKRCYIEGEEALIKFKVINNTPYDLTGVDIDYYVNGEKQTSLSGEAKGFKVYKDDIQYDEIYRGINTFIGKYIVKSSDVATGIKIEAVLYPHYELVLDKDGRTNLLKDALLCKNLTATKSICVIKANPNIMLEKEANVEIALPGEEINYKFELKNIGDVVLRNVSIDDSLLDKNTLNPSFIEKLDVGDSIIFEGKMTIPKDAIDGEEIINTAFATVEGKRLGSPSSSTIRVKTLPEDNIDIIPNIVLEKENIASVNAYEIIVDKSKSTDIEAEVYDKVNMFNINDIATQIESPVNIEDPYVYEPEKQSDPLPVIKLFDHIHIEDAVIYAEDYSIISGESVNIMNNVSARDNGGRGKDITKIVRVYGVINTAVPGNYTITYRVKGKNKRDVSKTIVIKVKRA